MVCLIHLLQQQTVVYSINNMNVIILYGYFHYILLVLFISITLVICGRRNKGPLKESQSHSTTSSASLDKQKQMEKMSPEKKQEKKEKGVTKSTELKKDINKDVKISEKKKSIQPSSNEKQLKEKIYQPNKIDKWKVFKKKEPAKITKQDTTKAKVKADAVLAKAKLVAQPIKPKPDKKPKIDVAKAEKQDGEPTVNLDGVQTVNPEGVGTVKPEGAGTVKPEGTGAAKPDGVAKTTKAGAPAKGNSIIKLVSKNTKKTTRLDGPLSEVGDGDYEDVNLVEAVEPSVVKDTEGLGTAILNVPSEPEAATAIPEQAEEKKEPTEPTGDGDKKEGKGEQEKKEDKEKEKEKDKKAETPKKPTVTVEPKVCYFTMAGGKLSHVLTNSGETRIVFKVKCSNNNEYGILPIYGFTEISGSTTLVVTRLPGKPKEDVMVIQWTQAKEDMKDPKEAFKSAPQATVQSITVPLIVRAAAPVVPGTSPTPVQQPEAGKPDPGAGKPPIPGASAPVPNKQVEGAAQTDPTKPNIPGALAPMPAKPTVLAASAPAPTKPSVPAAPAVVPTKPTVLAAPAPIPNKPSVPATPALAKPTILVPKQTVFGKPATILAKPSIPEQQNSVPNKDTTPALTKDTKEPQAAGAEKPAAEQTIPEGANANVPAVSMYAGAQESSDGPK